MKWVLAAILSIAPLVGSRLLTDPVTVRAQESPTPRPNLVLIVGDDQR